MTFVFLSLVVGGAVVLWQRLRVTHIWIDAALHHYLPQRLVRVLTNAESLSGWLALIAVILVDPLFPQGVFWRIYLGDFVSWFIVIFMSTVVVLLGALVVRTVTGWLLKRS